MQHPFVLVVLSLMESVKWMAILTSVRGNGKSRTIYDRSIMTLPKLRRGMIIFGAFTLFLGIPFYLFLADKPKSRWFRLTPEEEKIVEERSRDNAVLQNRVIKREHMYEALKEPRLYCFFFISLLSNLQNGAITTFVSQIINNMGFDVSLYPP